LPVGADKDYPDTTPGGADAWQVDRTMHDIRPIGGQPRVRHASLHRHPPSALPGSRSSWARRTSRSGCQPSWSAL